MLASSIPVKFPIPFANAANPVTIRPIPTASQIGIQDGAASLTDGFPIKTQTPIGAGGTPPYGQDMNGILNQATAWLQWMDAGGPIKYDAAFQTVIGGYPQGALVQSATTLGLFWFSLVDNNVTNPDTGGAGWTLLGRIRLNTNLTIYVATTGSDTLNTGLTIGSPFLTTQRAWTYIANTYDLNGFSATIQVADGTYNAGVVANGSIPGQSGPASVTINGNSGAPTNVIFNVIGATAFQSAYTSSFKVQNFVMQGSSALSAYNGGLLHVGVGITFGAVTGAQCAATYMGQIVFTAPYTITGGGTTHWTCDFGGSILCGSITVTITGTPNFVGQFAECTTGNITAPSNVFSGAATGQRYSIAANGVINTNGAATTYLPGNSAGATATGGQYV